MRAGNTWRIGIERSFDFRPGDLGLQFSGSRAQIAEMAEALEHFRPWGCNDCKQKSGASALVQCADRSQERVSARRAGLEIHACESVDLCVEQARRDPAGRRWRLSAFVDESDSILVPVDAHWFASGIMPRMNLSFAHGYWSIRSRNRTTHQSRKAMMPMAMNARIRPSATS